MKTTNQVIIIDLEATCWERDADYQKQHSEIIEIGICTLDTATGRIIANEGILVKPVKSEISKFCTRLTSITPAMVAQQGLSLREACAMLEQQYQSKQLTWASYGAYDKTMLMKQCTESGISYPMSNQHINVKTLFAETFFLDKGIGMDGALKMLDLPLQGHHHRGVDDAKNIARIFSSLI